MKIELKAIGYVKSTRLEAADSDENQFAFVEIDSESFSKNLSDSSHAEIIFFMNQIDSAKCKILKVKGRRVYLEGFKAVNGSPVLDIKPVKAS